MPTAPVLAIVQAGGAGGRMDVLTRERAKPALPFAGSYQLVDFPLSNLAHSGVSDVWLSLQYQAGSLEEQVSSGRPWDLDRTRGGMRLLMPSQGTGSSDEEGFAQGNADLLYRIRDDITLHGAEVVLVLSADHVYRFDFNDAIRTHRERDAECTVVTTEVDLDRASDHATVAHDEDGWVTGFAYKPEKPSTAVVATEIFLYHPGTLVEVLEELHGELTAKAGDGDSGLGDFGEHLLPRLVERGRTCVHAMPGYWRDLGQPHLYLEAHRDLLLDDQGLFNTRGWPILTAQPQRRPPRILDGATVVDSLVSPGATVAGTVVRSVLGPDVRVDAGARVEDCVLVNGCVVEADAEVYAAVVDSDSVLEQGSRVGEVGAVGTSDPARVTLVGRQCRVGAGVRVDAGARLEPGTTA